MSDASTGPTMTHNQPVAPLGDGRDPSTGRFLPGNKGGPGNPHARRVAELREALLAEVTPADLRLAVRALIVAAHAGDLAAIRELLDRTIGRAAVVVEDEADVGVRFIPPPTIKRIG